MTTRSEVRNEPALQHRETHPEATGLTTTTTTTKKSQNPAAWSPRDDACGSENEVCAACVHGNDVWLRDAEEKDT